MVEQYTGGRLTWIDAKNPTREEIRELLLTYELPPSLLGDLTTPVPRSDVSMCDGTLKITMDFPVVKPTDEERRREIKFLIAEKAMISVRYEDMEAVHRFKKEFDVLSTLYTKTKRGARGAHLFASLLSELYDTLSTKLDYLESKIDDIEDDIFRGREKEMVFTISEIGRKLIVFRQILKSHGPVLAEAALRIEECFSKATAAGMQPVSEQYAALLGRTNDVFETLDELRNTNLALLTTKQNEIMKTLTILAFATFPLIFFSSIFGMNTVGTPISGNPYDFWIILSLMFGVMLAFLAYFKYKKWM